MRSLIAPKVAMLNVFFQGLMCLLFWWIPFKQEPILYPVEFQSNIACDLIVDAGPDTNVCYPGGHLTLMGSVTGNALFTQWSPSTGLNNPNILNPVANITGPITYTLTGWGIDPNNPNLVVNGNFESGNTGFVSDYSYVADIPILQNEMLPEGTYTVINNPNLVHSDFSACNDHTPGAGVNMMVVNGAASLQDVWCQTISITANTWYNVSAWVASVHPSSPAILRFSINGVAIGSTVNAPSTTCQWVPFNATWYSGSTTSATICILNLNTASGGNDFAIDDISMVSLCKVEDEVEITLVDETAPLPDIQGPVFLCAGETGTYTASFPPEPEILNYTWSVPPGVTILNGQGTNQITVLWEDEQTGDICLMIETRCDEAEGCLEVTVSDVPDLPLLSGPPTLCPGETATFYTQEQNPDDEYNWILPPEVNLISGAGTNEIEIEWASAGDVEICLEVTNECGTTDNCTYMSLYPSYLTLFDTVLCTGTTIVINGTTYGNGIWSGIEYFITENGCDSIVEIEISEATSLEFMFEVTLCPGDSVFLNGAYQTQEGFYVDSFTTVSGCDSIVTTEVIVSVSDTTYINSTTCDPTQEGTTIETFTDGNCDSTVITQVVFTGPDTLEIFLTSCDPSQIGVTVQSFTNMSGCDSTVITTVSFLLSDTTMVHTWTCTYSDTGTTSVLLINSNGCDSLVIHQNEYAGSDTTFLFSETCFAADSGWVFSSLQNQFGCDSVLASYDLYVETDTTYFFTTSCAPADTGIVITILTNANGCDSLIITTTSLEPPEVCLIEAAFAVEQPLCYGDVATVSVDIQTGTSPFNLTWTHNSQTGNFNYSSTGIYSFPLNVNGSVVLKLVSSNGLVLNDTIYINPVEPLEIDITSTDHEGWGVPCFGDDTGEAHIEIFESGTPPLLFEWSTGDNTQSISNVTAGIYYATVTDNNGCLKSDTIVITEPPPMQYDIITDDITCFGYQDGRVDIINAQGGVMPWTVTLNGNSSQGDMSFENLQPGLHKLEIEDQNGCILEEEFIITEPDDWSIDLGPDTTLVFGTIFNLNPQIIGLPQLMLQYHWSDGMCVNCPARTFEAIQSSTITLLATDENGCTDEDAINIHIFIDKDLYIPNVFSPNDDQINDYFNVYANSFVEEIEEFTIFDRWGNMVFQKFHFQPDDQSTWWDGQVHDKIVNPGVYVYKVIVKYKDGLKEVRHGDVTLIR